MRLLKRIDFYLTRLFSSSSVKQYNLARFLRCTIDFWIIKLDSIFNKDHILIYQQGRVASTSVYEAISNLDLNARVYHVHLLSPEKAEQRIRQARAEKARIDRYLFVGKYLGQMIRAGKHKNWKIVSIFREPISTLLSIYLLNAHSSFKRVDFGKSTEEVAEQMLAELQHVFETNDPENWDICNWYDDVFFNEVGIDVYSETFDQVSNFKELSKDEVSVLLLKFEALKGSIKTACSGFFNVSEAEINLKYANVHKNDAFNFHHEYLKNNLKISNDAFDRIFSTKFCNHFYSNGEKQELRSRWCNS